MRYIWATGAVVVASSVALALGVTAPHASQSKSFRPIATAHFAATGEIALPVGYRQWRHVGTRYKPVGINILDGEQTKTPEILNAYVEPTAMAAFERTGEWQDGAQIVKEFTAVRVGPGCNEQTLVCESPLGAGIFETGYVGLGMMVKDAKRFPSAPGHWGYFSFGHKPPPYDVTAAVRSVTQCTACHIKLAADTDYVIVKAHIGLMGQQMK